MGKEFLSEQERKETPLEIKLGMLAQNDPGVLQRKLKALMEEDTSQKQERKNVLEEVKKDGAFYHHIAPQFRNDPEIALEAAKTYNRILLDVSRDLRQDIPFLTKIAQINPKALAFADEEIMEKLGLKNLLEN